MNSQTVTLSDPSQQNSANPYFFTFSSANKTRTVSVPPLAGYSIGYTLCYNNTNCHGAQPTPSMTVDLLDSSYCQSADGYADLWWHYTPVTPTSPPTPTPTPCINIAAKDPSGNPVIEQGMSFSYNCGGGWAQCFSVPQQNVSSYNIYGYSAQNGGGAGVALNNGQVLVGVTPAPGGGALAVRNNNHPGFWYNIVDWQDYWWTPFPPAGNSCPTVTYIVATPTPTPTPTPALGTIRARAVQISNKNIPCTDLGGGEDIRSGGIGGLAGSTFSLSGGVTPYPTPTGSPQNGSSYVVFNNANASGPMYNILPQPPAGNVLARYCWQRTTPPTQGEDSSALLYAGDTLTWDIGYVQGNPWSQANGGDVYASGMLQSFVPGPHPPQVFIPDGTGGYPGVATYGTNYDFDSGVGQGQTWVSRTNWLANEPNLAATNYYQLMYSQFGGDPGPWDYVNPISPIIKPASRPTPYYVQGNMTTSGNWSVGAGQTIIFIVDGNLTIAGKINITGSGFVSFIVNGDITVDPSVGVPYTSSAPVVEGIYITSPAGTLRTGTSGAGTERFVGRGMFIAGNFSLQRNVGDAGNPTTSSELFVYNPQLLLSMPEQMKKLSVSWQEVAP